MTIALHTAASLLCPIALGGLLGLLLRLAGRGRVVRLLGVTGCLVLPAAVAVVATISYPIIGLWDAVAEGLLCGVGVVWTALRYHPDPRKLALGAASVIVGCLLVEGGVRLLLGPPPAYPIGDGPHFLLTTVLRTTGPDSPMFHDGEIPQLLERGAMQGDLGAGRMEQRPPSAMVTKEAVCSIAYGSKYSSVIDVSRELDVVFPQNIAHHPGATRRVLHVGDSMVYGANAPRELTFTANLERLEPNVQHINGGISGMAPDDYYVVLRRWVARESFDLAVMYLFAGNDMIGLDAPHPCSDWESILVYQDGRARLRFPDGPRSERGIGVSWLVTNSPLPYLLRLMIVQGSAAAAFLGRELDSLAAHAAYHERNNRFQRLEAILRSTRDELRALGIPFVVVVLPSADGPRGDPEGPSAELSREVLAISSKLSLPALDATALIRRALSRGEQPIQSDRTHLNEEGHRLVAKWLHEKLSPLGGLVPP